MSADNAKSIVIVGGGTSGWLSAAFLSATLPDNYLGEVRITLVEASDIPTIGVGEATTPSLGLTLNELGIDEYEFMRACDATFKHGIQFHQWVKCPDEQNEYYFHPFQAPLRAGSDNFAKHWINTPLDERGIYAELSGIQSTLAQRGFAPKTRASGNFNGNLPYAYHLDAGKLATFLKTIGKNLGVEHLVDKVCTIDDDGENIRKIKLESGRELLPDLVIDCTGFAARIINRDKNNPFVSKQDTLFCDTAITTRVDLNSIDDVVPYTKSTAQKNGWIWDINLTNRRGVGHVFSSRYISEEEAAVDLAQYLNTGTHNLEYRKLDMRIGYHEKQWRGNCVSVGLAAGFLEPLESTGIYLVEMANWALSQSIARFFNGYTETANNFNVMMQRHFENITDFIKLHYCLSQRTDSKFWRDNCDPATIPDSLKALLDRWKHDAPNDFDFDHSIVCFNSENYQYILYGMQGAGEPERSAPDRSRDILHQVRAKRNALLERQRTQLVKNNALLKTLADEKISARNQGAISGPLASTNYRVK